MNMRIRILLLLPQSPYIPHPAHQPFLQHKALLCPLLSLFTITTLCRNSAIILSPKTAGAFLLVSLLLLSANSSSPAHSGVINKTWIRSRHAPGKSHLNNYYHTQNKFQTLYLVSKTPYYLAPVCLTHLILYHSCFSYTVFHEYFYVSVWSGLSEQKAPHLV